EDTGFVGAPRAQRASANEIRSSRLRHRARKRAGSATRARTHYRREAKRGGIPELSRLAGEYAVGAARFAGRLFRLESGAPVRPGWHAAAGSRPYRRIREGWRGPVASSIQPADGRNGA